MGNRKRARVQNSSPEDTLGESEQQDNVNGLHPLLINVIVRHVMTFLDLADIRKFRGVHRLWSQEAIGLLRELKKPLFYLTLNSTRYIDGNRYSEQRPLGEKKILLNLSKTVGLAGSGSWPPISLHLDSYYDEQSARQRKNLSWIFENHVSDLMKLIISRKGNCCEIPIPLEATLSLKNLKLSYSFDRTPTNYPTTFLAACTELQKLEITRGFGYCPNLPLPDSLTTLKLSLNIKYKLLVALAEKSLPNLTKLSLGIANEDCVNGAFHKLLDRFRTSLKYLCINGSYFETSPPETLEEYRFPVMDNLEELKLERFFRPLEANINNLPLYLPKLKKLSMIDFNEISAEKWLSGHRLETVTSLQINWVEGRPGWWKFRNTDQEMVAKICTTFPNLTDLSLAFSEEDVSGLRVVFEKMQQLEKLTIYCTGVKGMICALGSVLLEPIAKKKQESDISRMETQRATYSVLKLTKLKYLCIAQLSGHYDNGVHDKRHRIPDSLFTRAFLKMDNLRCLCLDKELMPSERVASTWRSKGRSLKLP